jgi:hypothetical protein
MVDAGEPLGLEDGFAAVRRRRGVLAAWDEPMNGRLVISVLVFEPNTLAMIDVIGGVLEAFITGVTREVAPEIPLDEPA